MSCSSCGRRHSPYFTNFRSVSKNTTFGSWLEEHFDTMTGTNIFDVKLLRTDLATQLRFLNCLDSEKFQKAFSDIGLNLNLPNDIPVLVEVISKGMDKEGRLNGKDGKPLKFDGLAIVKGIVPDMSKVNTKSCAITFLYD